VDNIIVAKNLSLGYNDAKIIKNSSFNIRKKDFVIISGASGSGKSTLLKSLYADLPVGEGYLNVAGIDMREINSKSKNLLRRHLGVVFQDFKLIDDWNIEKNIMLPLIINGYSKDKALIQVEKLLAHINLSIKALKYPYELSGGEQQRVALARALAHNPLLILADEPTGNLDDYSSDMVWSLLKSANAQLNVTVIVVTHRIPTDLGIDYRHFQIHDGGLHEIS
jgi:cell division transport system ATP-binding protein